jgi:predicted Zn-ribbon and HTH transcriptional regulator
MPTTPVFISQNNDMAVMALDKCTNCGHEEDAEVHEPPAECPFCGAKTEETADLWNEME